LKKILLGELDKESIDNDVLAFLMIVELGLSPEYVNSMDYVSFEIWSSLTLAYVNHCPNNLPGYKVIAEMKQNTKGNLVNDSDPMERQVTDGDYVVGKDGQKYFAPHLPKAGKTFAGKDGKQRRVLGTEYENAEQFAKMQREKQANMQRRLERASNPKKNLNLSSSTNNSSDNKVNPRRKNNIIQPVKTTRNNS